MLEGQLGAVILPSKGRLHSSASLAFPLLLSQKLEVSQCHSHYYCIGSSFLLIFAILFGLYHFIEKGRGDLSPDNGSPYTVF